MHDPCEQYQIRVDAFQSREAGHTGASHLIAVPSERRPLALIRTAAIRGRCQQSTHGHFAAAELARTIANHSGYSDELSAPISSPGVRRVWWRDILTRPQLLLLLRPGIPQLHYCTDIFI
ncbi:hypothetical protein T01_6390 [Trichinella spiralis]|uniref:Uncharacterized protein n=1 Tax=Trichinella spiralis TaxID=6334 RepID=A0A0V1BSB1_TRISP|nr:hypothetical protein T01_6390 [Trichinella spiralis]